MTKLYGNYTAFGHPGIEPRWTHGNKDEVGTAYTIASHVWFTVWNVEPLRAINRRGFRHCLLTCRPLWLSG